MDAMMIMNIIAIMPIIIIEMKIILQLSTYKYRLENNRNIVRNLALLCYPCKKICLHSTAYYQLMMLNKILEHNMTEDGPIDVYYMAQKATHNN